ncbi:MAG: hypothetical protein ABEJ82_09165 [Haloplanus sp.]
MNGEDSGADARDAPADVDASADRLVRDDAPGTTHDAETTDDDAPGTTDDREVYATTGLVEVLLEMAADAEPAGMNVVLAATPAGDFETDLGVEPDVPVLTTFYLPDAGRAVRDVFGVDLGTPAGSGRARFLTHPQGPAELTRRDDLAAVVLLAVPPWESVTAFDRRGRRLALTILDADPPTESLAPDDGA